MTFTFLGIHRPLACLTFFLLNVFLSHAQRDDDGVSYIPGEWIVKIESGFAVHKLLDEASLHFSEAFVVQPLSSTSQIYLIGESNPSNESSWRSKRSWFAQHPDVLAAQFNHLVSSRETLPNDPNITEQWHHVNDNDSDIDSDLAWDITTGGTSALGQDIVVCVIEADGTDVNHPDLAENHWTNSAEIPGNGIDDDANGYIDDFSGWNTFEQDDTIPPDDHGSAVSGMIGARGNNAEGGAGVNWNVQIMQVVIGDLNEAQVIEAYDYPLSMRTLYNSTGGQQGAFVVATNASWGIDGADPSLYPIWCAYYDDLGAAGILNCGATANNDVNVDEEGDMPTGCSSDYMLSVTATDNADERTFSAYGPTTIDLAAPGEAVWLPNGTGGYGSTGGTSFASPCVAGAIALLYSAPCPSIAALSVSNPQFTADLIRSTILSGVDPIPALTDETVTGGRLNVRNSLDLVIGACGPAPECSFTAFSGEAICEYESSTNTVEAAINLSVDLSDWFCEVDSIGYYQPGMDTTYINLLSTEISFGTAQPSYTLTGLLSNTNYEVFALVSGQSSETLLFETTSCNFEIPGCTDLNALNFEFFATFDDGSCIYPCVAVEFQLTTDCDAEETGWLIVNEAGDIIQEVLPGSLPSDSIQTWELCLNQGCYTLLVNDAAGDGLEGCENPGDFILFFSNGLQILEMQTPAFGSLASYPFCVTYGELPGCMDVFACNFEPQANVSDESCVFFGGPCDDGNPLTDGDVIIFDCSCEGQVSGCMDETACNYHPEAEVDDGSCLVAGCLDPVADNYNPLAVCSNSSCEYSCVSYSLVFSTDCWGEESAWEIVSEEGYLLYSSDFFTYQNQITINETICLSVGCYTIHVYDSFGDGMNGTASDCPEDGDYSFEDQFGNEIFSMLAPNADFGFSESQQFCVPVPEALGCVNQNACNYNPSAWVDDGSCILPGCVDADACNFDTNAGCDDGSCEYESCLSICVADFDGDGSILVGDLLTLLANYGCVLDCGAADLNNDGAVSSPDLLIFLSAFGQLCP